MALQVAKLNWLKFQARHEARKLILPNEVLIELYQAIDKVRLPFMEFLEASNKDIIEAFISRVMAGLIDVENKYKEKIKKCFMEHLY